MYNVCREAWSNRNINVDDKLHVCTRCNVDRGAPEKFSAENNMDPESVPPELSDLTQCEEMLIARAFQVMQLYVRKRHNTISCKGHVLT